MSKRYLITGGTGFIGSAIVKRLVEEENFVRIVDNNIRGDLRKVQDVLDRVELVEADVRDYDKINEVCKDIDSVIHLAYINGTEYFYSKPKLVLDVAIKGMINLMDACYNNNIKEFILASSSEVYQTPPVIPTPENVPLIIPDINNPRYSYGGGKIACELIMEESFLIKFLFLDHIMFMDLTWDGSM